MGDVRQKEMGGLFDLDGALRAGRWPVADDYRVVGDRIVPGERIRAMAVLLAEPETFLSFARLGAHNGPGEGAILAWVRRHGLLRRQDHGTPATVTAFGAEAVRAHKLLTAYQHHRIGDVAALRARMGFGRISPPDRPGTGPVGHVLLDGTPARHIKRATDPLSDKDVLDAALDAVHAGLNQRIGYVRMGFGITGRLEPQMPDRVTAMYWSFAALVDGRRPLAVCEGCGRTFEKTRRDKRVCKPGCRTTKKRRLAADQL